MMRRLTRTGGCIVLAIAIGLGVYLGGIRISGNFNTVVAGQVYRSAQPTASDIAAYAKMHGIRTILNLRGASAREAWYDAEINQSKALGIQHVDYAMSASRELTPQQAAELIAIMDNAEKPLLIHCKAGADRSGLASALYLAAIAKRGETAAEGQISLRYGHISLPISSTYAMDRAFEDLEPWLGFPGS